MNWILGILLMVCLQGRAQDSASSVASAQIPNGASVTMEPVNPPTEIQVAVPTQEQTKQLSEKEIPVNLEAPQKAAATEHPMMRMLMSAGILLVLGGAGFFWLRKYRYSNPQTQATQIKVLSQHYLGPKKSLAIVRVAGESVLIGITDQNISMIKSLSLLDEDIPEETPKEFKSVFSLKNRQEASQETTREETENRDEFSLTGIKDFVSGRLKNMRTLE